MNLPRRPRHTASGRAAAVLLGALVTVVALAGPASAHAVLRSSTPAEGERLPEAPTSVSLTFTEEVSLGLGAVTVLDRDGRRVDEGSIDQPAPNRVRTAVQEGLPKGTYLISYRVTSADGHVVTGGIAFAVGDDLDAAAVADLSATAGPLEQAMGFGARLALFSGVLVAVGLALFLRFAHDGAADAARLVRWARVAAILGALGALGTLASRAMEATGQGLSVLGDTAVLREVLRQAGLGWWLVGVLAGLACIYLGTGLRNGAVGPALVLYGCLVCVGAFALTGHTTQTDSGWALGLADAVHVGVAALWTGGLVGMFAVLRWRARSDTGSDDASDEARATLSAGTADIVVRVSTTAALSVAVLWVTGAVQAWWTVGSWSALASASYGRLLLLKLGLVVATLAIAAWNRYRLVPGLLDAQDDLDAAREATSAPASSGTRSVTSLALPAWDRLLRTVRAELVILLAVVAVTGVLVETTPSRANLGGAQPFEETLPVNADLQVNLGVTPGTTGRNELHITYFGNDGRTEDAVESATVEMTLPGKGVGPITVNGSPLGKAHFVVVTEQLSVAGTWRIEVISRIGTFDQRRTAFEVPIGGAGNESSAP